MSVAIRFCRHGHAYDEANTYIDTYGRKVCRECKRRSARDHANGMTQPQVEAVRIDYAAAERGSTDLLRALVAYGKRHGLPNPHLVRWDVAA